MKCEGFRGGAARNTGYICILHYLGIRDTFAYYITLGSVKAFRGGAARTLTRIFMGGVLRQSREDYRIYFSYCSFMLGISFTSV
jgi:hypothetical protein